MATFVVSHEAPLVSYLVAASIKLRYGRQARIHVIEHYSGLRSPERMPWCGVSTVSHERIAEWEFLLLTVLRGVLRDVLLFVESIHIKEPPRTPGWECDPDHSTIWAIESASRYAFGIFYRIDMLLATLRLFLQNASNVSFSSIKGPLRPQDVEALRLYFGTDCVFIKFEEANLGGSSPYGLNSHGVCSVNIARNHVNNHQTSKLKKMEDVYLPEAIWFPLYRASMGVFADAIFTHYVDASKPSKLIHISPLSHEYDGNHICMHLDLLWGLRACGYALDCIQHLVPAPPATRL